MIEALGRLQVKAVKVGDCARAKKPKISPYLCFSSSLCDDLKRQKDEMLERAVQGLEFWKNTMNTLQITEYESREVKPNEQFWLF